MEDLLTNGEYLMDDTSGSRFDKPLTVNLWFKRTFAYVNLGRVTTLGITPSVVLLITSEDSCCNYSKNFCYLKLHRFRNGYVALEEFTAGGPLQFLL